MVGPMLTVDLYNLFDLFNLSDNSKKDTRYKDYIKNIYEANSKYNNIQVDVKSDILADIQMILSFKSLPIKIRRYIISIVSNFGMFNENLSENMDFYINNVYDYNGSSFGSYTYHNMLQNNIFNIKNNHLLEWDSLCQTLVIELTFIKQNYNEITNEKVQLMKYFNYILDISYRLMEVKKADQIEQNYPF